MNNYLIDIDGTICDDIPNEEWMLMHFAKSVEESKFVINDLYHKGHIITFFTARTEDLRTITEDWLKTHGFLYHNLLMNKPRGGNYIWIDNLSVKGVLVEDPKQFWNNFHESVYSI